MTDVLHRPVETGGPVHRLAAGTELLGQYQGSGLNVPKYLVRRSDGQVMQLPAAMYRVLSGLEELQDHAQIAVTLSSEFGEEVAPAEVTQLIEERLRPFGIIADEGTGVTDAGTEAPRPPLQADPLLALKHRVGIVPARAVWRVAGVFGWLYRRPVWLLALAAFVAVDAAILLQGGFTDRMVTSVDAFVQHPELTLVVMGLTVLSAAFHECGHVSACRYGGARPGDMGIGLYIVWPAFYSTVTDAYRLSRGGRLRTDLGGVYFNTLFMTAVGLLYLRTGEAWLLLALIGLHTETAWQFLPSVRLDGFYILADIVGVPDLFGYLRPVLTSLLPGRPTDPKVRALRPWPRRLIVLWVVLVVPTLLFYVGVFLAILPRVVPGVLADVVLFLHELQGYAQAGDVVQTAIGVIDLVLLVLPWIGTVLIVHSLLRLLWQKVRGRWGRGSPEAPADGALSGATRRWAAATLIAALAAAVVGRVLAVAGSHPTGAGETRWVDDVLAGGREPALLATAVLASCLVALVVARRLPFLAAAVPLLAVVCAGPAQVVLATSGPVALGAAEAAVGAVVLVLGRGRPAAVVGVLAVLAGVVTAPLLCLPLAAVVVLSAVERARRGPGRHEHPPYGRGSARCGALPAWCVPAAASAAAVVGVLLAGGAAPVPPDGDQPVVVLLLGGLVALGASFVRELRAVAVGLVLLVVLAAVPWPGAAGALVLVVVAAGWLAALLGAGFVAVPGRPRARAALRVPVTAAGILLVLLGSLFPAASTPRLPHAQLAAWLREAPSVTGAVAVPDALYRDLVHDGVPASRLVRDASPSAGQAAWVVRVGAGGPPSPVVRFGDGAAALSLGRPVVSELRPAVEEPVRSELATLAAVGRADDEAARRASRQALAQRLLTSVKLQVPPDVRAALAADGIDPRILAVLADLTRAHGVTLGSFPDPPPAAGTARVAVVVTALDGSSTARAATAAVVRQQLQGEPPALAPATVLPGPGGVLAGWSTP